jgi:3-oxoacid CoA-transferase subunit A
MINKKVNTVQEALQGVENGMTIMLGGFGLCGIPEIQLQTSKKQ